MRTPNEFTVAKEEREEAIKKRLFKVAEMLVEEFYHAHCCKIFFSNEKLARKFNLYELVWSELSMRKLKDLLIESGYKLEPHYKTFFTHRFVFLKEKQICVDGYILSINKSTTPSHRVR